MHFNKFNALFKVALVYSFGHCKGRRTNSTKTTTYKVELVNLFAHPADLEHHLSFGVLFWTT